jgi:hypothetical protein
LLYCSYFCLLWSGIWVSDSSFHDSSAAYCTFTCRHWSPSNRLHCVISNILYIHYVRRIYVFQECPHSVKHSVHCKYSPHFIKNLSGMWRRSLNVGMTRGVTLKYPATKSVITDVGLKYVGKLCVRNDFWMSDNIHTEKEVGRR